MRCIKIIVLVWHFIAVTCTVISDIKLFPSPFPSLRVQNECSPAGVTLNWLRIQLNKCQRHVIMRAGWKQLVRNLKRKKKNSCVDKMKSSKNFIFVLCSLNLFTLPVERSRSRGRHWSVNSSCYLRIKFTIVFTPAPVHSSQIGLPPPAAASSFTVKTTLNWAAFGRPVWCLLLAFTLSDLCSAKCDVRKIKQ